MMVNQTKVQQRNDARSVGKQRPKPSGALTKPYFRKK